MANFNFNRVILGGRLTANPELKQTTSGTPVCQFSIAINRKKSKDGEQTADFINCVAWRERAELIVRWFKKGSSICVVGELQTRSWEDQNGQKRNVTEVVVSEVNFVDSKNDAQTSETAGAIPYIPDAYKSQQNANFEVMDDNDELPF